MEHSPPHFVCSCSLSGQTGPHLLKKSIPVNIQYVTQATVELCKQVTCSPFIDCEEESLLSIPQKGNILLTENTHVDNVIDKTFAIFSVSTLPLGFHQHFYNTLDYNSTVLYYYCTDSTQHTSVYLFGVN